MVRLAQKNKIPKNIRKSILQPHKRRSLQKTAQKKTKCSWSEAILKIGHKINAKAIDFKKWSVIGSKIKIPKNMHKSILQPH